METVNDLVNAAIGDLRTRRSTELIDYSAPQYPACIFFFGQRSADFYQDIHRGLSDGWGDNITTIPFFALNDPAGLAPAASQAADAAAATPSNDQQPLLDLTNGSHVGVSAVQQAVMNMLSHQTSFGKMNQVAVYCVLDSTGLTPDQFRQWYLAVNDINKALAGMQTRSMLMVVLNNSLGIANASQITEQLADLYADESIGGAGRHLYDSVFLYGNQRKDGSYINLFSTDDVQFCDERNLFADLVLLTNSQTDSVEECESRLFSTSQPAVTAAFSYVDKPRRDIVVVALKVIVSVLGQLMEGLSRSVPSNDDINRALGIESGHSLIAEEYQSTIDDINAQYQNFLQWVPAHQLPSNIAGMPFDQADRESFGCLSAFLRENQYRKLNRVLNGSSGSGSLDARITAQLTRSLNAVQLLALPEQEWDRKIATAFNDLALNEQTARRAPTPAAISQMMLCAVTDQVREHTLQIVHKLRAAAERTVNDFIAIQRSIARAASVQEDGTHMDVDSFYRSCVESFFADAQRRNDVFAKLLRIGNSAGDILDVLHKDALQPLFVSEYNGRHIFEMDFMDEMVERLAAGKASDAALQVVGKELVMNVSDYVGYRTLIPLQERTMEAYMLHIDNNPLSAAGKLYRFLDEYSLPSGVGRVFFNSGSRDNATSIWFYQLTEQNLRA